MILAGLVVAVIRRFRDRGPSSSRILPISSHVRPVKIVRVDRLRMTESGSPPAGTEPGAADQSGVWLIHASSREHPDFGHDGLRLLGDETVSNGPVAFAGDPPTALVQDQQFAERSCFILSRPKSAAVTCQFGRFSGVGSSTSPNSTASVV